MNGEVVPLADLVGVTQPVTITRAPRVSGWASIASLVSTLSTSSGAGNREANHRGTQVNRRLGVVVRPPKQDRVFLVIVSAVMSVAVGAAW